MKAFWLITKRATVWVQTNSEGIVTHAAPLIRTFIGQHLSNCTFWLSKHFGGKPFEEGHKGLEWERSERIIK